MKVKSQKSKVKSAPPKYTHACTSAGQAMMITVVFFLFISLAIMFGLVNPTLSETKLARSLSYSSQSYFIAEAGVEDTVYRLKEGLSVDPSETLSLNGATTTTVITDVSGNEKSVVASGNAEGNVRKASIQLSTGAGASFNYGVQAGEGGFEMESSANIQGNVYSNGPIEGGSSARITGDAISAGPSGLIEEARVTGSAYAHTIRDSDIDGDAYYQTISGTNVDGTEYPGSADQPLAELPITDSTIDGWKSQAEAGGTLGGSCTTYTISSNTTLGPKKINCNLNVQSSKTLTLQGPLWVNGNITIGSSGKIKVDPSLTGQSIVIIADNPANRTTSSKVTLSSSVSFTGAGTGSYILVVSQNNDGENGGANKAITVSSSATGALLVYAAHGIIDLSSSVSLKEVTGYKIEIGSSAQVTYDSGLASLLFTSGPGGSWNVGSWKEVQ